MMHFVTCATTLLAWIWLALSAAAVGTALIAFTQVWPDPEEHHLAGRMAGAVFSWWGLVGLGVLGLLVLSLVYAAWYQWRELLRARSTVLIIAALAVAGLHGAVMSVNHVAASRRAELPERMIGATLTPEQDELKARFDAAHTLAERLMGLEMLVTFLVGLGGGIILLRSGDGRG